MGSEAALVKGDVPETVAHCHREFTVYYGAELQHKMKGVISERQENPVEYCETQSTISVNGEEFKPLTGFAFEKLSPGEFAQGIRRNFVRAFSNEGQPGEKRRAFFQGGARPRPFVLRPH
ncbi:MAG: hypothetical protein M1815_001522 [Lichina confinis]|nr:MAG: hypothetical protein M1815_001522 [Lichina confinis]